MRSIFFILFSVLSFITLSQTGPGGVGSSSNNIVWLDANTLSLSNNDLVSSWSNISGNSNDATQASATLQPIFKTGQINGLPAVQFDGTDDFLEFGSNITTGAITTFLVYRRSGGTSLQGLLTYNHHLLLSNSGKLTSYYISPNKFFPIDKTNSTFSVASISTSSNSTSGTLTYTNNSSTTSYTRTSFINSSNSYIARSSGGSPTYLNGQFAEIITYNEELSLAEKNIVSEYLAAKYNLTSISGLYAYGSSYGNDVKGVGQESSGSNTSARGNDSLLISNASSLDNGDYLIVGSDNGGYSTSTSVPTGITERWTQVWRVDKTGTPGDIDIEFFLGSNGFSTITNYTILVESGDGDFTNGSTSVQSDGKSYNAVSNSIKFTGVSFNDGDYFTLAELSGDVEAIADGSWKSTSTWSCGCIPGEGDVVNIGTNFSVTIDSNASVRNLIIEDAGSLTFDADDTLKVYGDVTYGSSAQMNFSSGTIAFLGIGDEQEFHNNSGQLSELYNLYVNNNSGLAIISGDWGLSNNLQVSAGGMDVTSANSFILRSTPSFTSQILESMSNAFTGDFTIQRYISSRNADWADFASPVESATVADWDDDLYISGVGGNDGNATDGPGGPIFYSMYIFDWWNDVHVAVTDVNSTLNPGKGYELFLGDNTISYFGDTIDVVGVPNSGDISGSGTRINKGWNLCGNPFHSFLDYDEIDFSGTVPDNYYIFNTDNGSYDFFSGAGKAAIAPGQGYWVFKTTNGILDATVSESAKVDSHSSVFLRNKQQSGYFSINISNNSNQFNHSTYIDSDPEATDKIDQLDAFYLPSPQKDAPGIYSIASNSDEGLTLNKVSSWEESHIIPIEIYAGLNSDYTLKVNSIEAIDKDYSCIYLKDKIENEAIDLSVEGTYSFSSVEGRHQRFELILSNSYSDCRELLESPASDNSSIQKLDSQFDFRNSYGDWYLDYSVGKNLTQVELRIFNTRGQEVLSPVSFETTNAGSYQINGLENLDGIYVIQVKSKDEILNKTVKL